MTVPMSGCLVSIHAPVKGRPDAETIRADAIEVSIHAPVKGRPHMALVTDQRPVVSIHAPVKGRPGPTGHGKSTVLFQSTPP